MSLYQNATNGWMKSGLYLPTLHPGNLQNCFQENSVLQLINDLDTWCSPVCTACAFALAIDARFIQLTYVVNAYIANSVFYHETTFLISLLVWVRNIKISSSCWWFFLTATFTAYSYILNRVRSQPFQNYTFYICL